MKLNTSQKLLIAIAIPIVLFVSGVFLLKMLIENRMQKLSEETITAPNKFHYGELETTIIPGSLVLKDASIGWELPSVAQRVEMNSREIRLEGVKWLQMILFRELNIDELLFEQPELRVIRLPEKDTTSTGNKTSFKGLSCLHIKHIGFENGHLKVLQNPDDSIAAMAADTLNIELSGIALLLEKDGNPWEISNAECTLSNCELNGVDGLYNYQISQFHLSKKDSLIELRNFTMKSKYGKREFSAQLDKKKSRLDLSFPSVVLKGWQFDRLTKGQLAARVVTIDKMVVDVFTDRNVPHDKNKVHPLPQEVLLKSKLGMLIDSIVLTGGSVHYAELQPGKSQPGEIWFEPVEATVTNVTNDSARISKNPVMETVLQAGFQKSYATTHRIWMDLSSDVYAFTFSGNTGSMPFTAFNEFAKPLSGIVLQEGTVHQLKFKANADKNVANGELHLQYDNLDFVILNKKNKKAKLKSELAELLVISNDNIKGSEDYKAATMHVRRDPSHSFFKYWWSAIESGIKTTIQTDFAGKALDRRNKRKSKKRNSKSSR